jgi:hypothetical protein
MTMDAASDGVDASTDAAEGGPSFPDPDRGPPAWVELTVGPTGTCDELTPCGGDVVGTWDLEAGCFEDDVDAAFSRCPGATVTRSGRARGRVVFGADAIGVRVAQSEVVMDIHFPALCASFFSCDELEAAIRPRVTRVDCEGGEGTDCTCHARLETTIDQRDRYRTEDNQIVSESSGKRWDYCVQDDTLTYRDADRSASREPGIIELERR